jgi:hypothetical protein
MEFFNHLFQNNLQNNLADLMTQREVHPDIKARLANLKTQAAQSDEVLRFFPAPVWKPKFGDCLSGIFLGWQKRQPQPGEICEPHVEGWQILIQDESSRVHAIWGTPELSEQRLDK